MGCTTAKKEHEEFQSLAAENVSGLLKITITNAVIFHQAGAFKMDPYVVLKISNQEFTSKVAVKGGKKPNFFETFTFYINSSHQQYGRNLQVMLKDKKRIGSDNFIGYGMVDLNPVINLKKTKDQFRCMLSLDYKEAGFLNLIAQFIEQPYETVHFKFDQAVIRRNVSTFGTMNCYILVTVGEEVMKTSKRKDTKQKPPTWSDEIVTVRVLPSINVAVLQVIDDKEEVGKFEIPVSKLISSDDQQSFVEDFIYGEGISAGTLKFQTIKGKIAKFSNMLDHNKVILHQKVQPKQEPYFQNKPHETTPNKQSTSK